MVWDLLRTKKEKPAAGKTGYWRTFWRRRWDSNPRTLADQTISSRSRYDHFDTSPYLSQHQHLRKRGELMGRTKKNIQLKIPEKPRKIKGFRSGSYRIATTISSADPSTTWVHLHIQLLLGKLEHSVSVSLAPCSPGCPQILTGRGFVAFHPPRRRSDFESALLWPLRYCCKISLFIMP